METKLENHPETIGDRYHGKRISHTDRHQDFLFVAERGNESIAW